MSEHLSAPKGLLKFFILMRASKIPVSGIEILKEISALTDQEWKPSPGSIYFILNELNSLGFISELLIPKSKIKKYVTTGKGIEKLSLFMGIANQIIRKQLIFTKVTNEIIENKEMKDLIEMILTRLEDQR